MIARTALAVLVASFLCAQAAYAVEADDYDTNDDRMISPDEYKQFARDRNSPPITQFDKNGNCVLDGHEIPAANAALREAGKRASKWIDEFIHDNRGRPRGQPIHEFAVANNTKDAKDLKPRSWTNSIPIKVREKHEDISHDVAAKPKREVKPAQIAFTRDIHGKNELLVVNGAIMWPIHLRKERGLLTVPSLTINKVTNSKEPKKATDTMALRLGLDWERDGSEESTDYWRVNPIWTTDTSFHMDVRGIEAQWERVGAHQGDSAAYYPKGSSVGFRWRLILHAEYGRVHDNGTNKKLPVGKEYVRTGLKFDSLIVHKDTDSITAGITWEYLPSIVGDFRHRKLFKATLSYKIDESGNFKLMTSYVNGDTSTALERQQLWTAGIGITF